MGERDVEAERAERADAPPEAGGEAPPSEAPPRAPVLDADGMERPAFVLDFPDDPALSRLVRAFEAGNYALVRREAETVARDAVDPRVRDAALELRRRIEPDPLVKYLLGLSVALLVLLTLWAYTR